MRKRPKSRGAEMIGFGGHGKGREERGEVKKSQGSSKACHFCHRERH